VLELEADVELLVLEADVELLVLEADVELLVLELEADVELLVLEPEADVEPPEPEADVEPPEPEADVEPPEPDAEACEEPLVPHAPRTHSAISTDQDHAFGFDITPVFIFAPQAMKDDPTTARRRQSPPRRCVHRAAATRIRGKWTHAPRETRFRPRREPFRLATRS
jgi:hypothetical protein